MKSNKIFKAVLIVFAVLLLLYSVVLFSLEFVPVKRVIEENSIPEHIFYYEPKTTGPDLLNWTFFVDNVNGSRTSYSVKVIGENPFDILNPDDFEPISLYNLPGESMGVVFYGDIVKADLTDEGYDYIIYSTGWDLVAPIKRVSFRNEYVSKDYLTIYDFNKEERERIVKSWFD